MLIGTTTPGQNGPESNGNEGILDTLQISTTRALPLDAVYPGHLFFFFLGGVFPPTAEDTVSVF